MRTVQNNTVENHMDNSQNSTDLSKTIDTADLLLYRGEKYKQNRLKLKEEIGKTEDHECTFKPKLLAKTQRMYKNSSCTNSKSNLK